MRGPMLLAAALLVSSAGAARAADACCELGIVSQPGSPANLTITIKNVSPVTLVVVFTRPEIDYKVQVTSVETAKEAVRTERNKRMAWETGGKFEEIKPGASFTEKLHLLDMFDLKSGVYEVAISRSNIKVGGAQVTLEGTARITVP
jgi:hypothetical protein